MEMWEFRWVVIVLKMLKFSAEKVKEGTGSELKDIWARWYMR